MGGILRDIFAISFVRNGDRSLWYVYFIAFSYLIYPALFKVRNYKNGGVQILLLMLTSIFLILTFQHLLPNLYENIEIAIARIPILLGGIYISPYVYEKKPLNKKECFTLVFIILLKAIKILNGRIGLHFPVIFNNRIIDTYFAIPLLFVAVELLKKVHRSTIVNYCGKYSYEIYLIHVSARQIINLTFNNGYFFINFILYAALSFIIAPVLSKMSTIF